MSGSPPISKSMFLAGLQCPRLLWTLANTGERIPPPDRTAQSMIDEGDRIHALARETVPPERNPVFEAAYQADGRYARADILVPSEGGAFDLVEVKSATSVNETHLWDAAFQRDCLARAGVRIDRVFVMHLNNGYNRRGAIDGSRLFKKTDVTGEAEARANRVSELFDEFGQVIAGDDPRTPIGPQCKKPQPCPMIPLCWAFLPEHPVTELYCGGNLVFEALDAGITQITAVPKKALDRKQRIQQNVLTTGELHIDGSGVRRWLKRLAYPLWHLDFETISPAVPLFDATRPYQRIPFQFSLHVQDEPGGKARHVEYLAETKDDPRPGLLEALRAIGPKGTVLAYFMRFEKGVLEELGRDFPDHRVMTENLRDRMEDLIEPFQQFSLYHPEQHGSCSLKKVLPAWTDLAYDNMAVADGMTASLEYLKAMHGDATPEEREAVLKALRAYCRLDTLAMVELVGILKSL